MRDLIGAIGSILFMLVLLAATLLLITGLVISAATSLPFWPAAIIITLLVAGGLSAICMTIGGM